MTRFSRGGYNNIISKNKTAKITPATALNNSFLSSRAGRAGAATENIRTNG